jgi:hypothetical protein
MKNLSFKENISYKLCATHVIVVSKKNHMIIEVQQFRSRPRIRRLRASLTEPVNHAETELFRRIYGFGPKVVQNST